jgi:nucleoside-triphosphatase
MELEPSTEKSSIWVITGWRNAGKTTYCQKVIRQYQEAGLRVSGLLAPGRMAQGEKDGYYVTDLASGETRLFASNIPGETTGFQFGPMVFDNETMAWGNQRLQSSLQTDLLVIDELGFLEFYLHTGWMASFDVLRQGNYRLALVVIRPECLDNFAEMGFTFQVKEVLRPDKIINVNSE